jgi:glycosyltransferase involved in cell wall biosynthesis
MTAVDCLVSVVAPLHDDARILEDFIVETLAVLKASYSDYEVLLIDDGSRDDTAARMDALLKVHPCIRYIRLARHFGAETAIVSGLDSTIGDFVVVMRPESDPPGHIPAMVQLARETGAVVFGVRRDRHGEPLWLRLGAAGFYAAAKRFFGLDIPENSTHFRVLSRQVVNEMAAMKDSRRYLRLLTSHLGFTSRPFLYDPISRHGTPRFKGFAEAFVLAFDIVFSSSVNPLRFATWLGLAASALNLLYMGYVLGVYLWRSHVAEGWTTLSFQISGMFFLLSLILSLLGEYVGRILFERRERPLYRVLEERDSSVMLGIEGRVNIVKESRPR